MNKVRSQKVCASSSLVCLLHPNWNNSSVYTILAVIIFMDQKRWNIKAPSLHLWFGLLWFVLVFSNLKSKRAGMFLSQETCKIKCVVVAPTIIRDDLTKADQNGFQRHKKCNRVGDICTEKSCFNKFFYQRFVFPDKIAFHFERNSYFMELSALQKTLASILI